MAPVTQKTIFGVINHLNITLVNTHRTAVKLPQMASETNATYSSIGSQPLNLAKKQVSITVPEIVNIAAESTAALSKNSSKAPKTVIHRKCVSIFCCRLCEALKFRSITNAENRYIARNKIAYIILGSGRCATKCAVVSGAKACCRFSARHCAMKS